jgi:hypothetical protein
MKAKNGRRASRTAKASNSAREIMTAPFTDTVERSREVVLNGLKTLQEEAIRIVDRRFERDSEALRECQNCRNIVDLLAVQQRWLTGISLDYYHGGMRLGRAMQDMMSEEAMELREAAESTMQQASEQQESAMA